MHFSGVKAESLDGRFSFPGLGGNYEQRVSRKGGFGALEQDFVTMFFLRNFDRVWSSDLDLGFITMAMFFLDHLDLAWSSYLDLALITMAMLFLCHIDLAWSWSRFNTMTMSFLDHLDLDLGLITMAMLYLDDLIIEQGYQGSIFMTRLSQVSTWKKDGSFYVSLIFM